MKKKTNNCDPQSMDINNFKEISKLYLPESRRVITPFPLENRQSWLEDSPHWEQEFLIDHDTIKILSDVFGLEIHKKFVGRLSLLQEGKVICDGASPKSLYGRIENNGTLSVVAFFTDGGEEITRTEHASFSNFEVEWRHCPLLIHQPTER